MKAAATAQRAAVPAVVHEVLRTNGRPLERAARALFAPGVAYDFASVPAMRVGAHDAPEERDADCAAANLDPRADLRCVRIHTGPQAARSAAAIGARAYTLGHDIVFGDGEYAPHTPPGRSLLAHELRHTAQHNDGSIRRTLAVRPATRPPISQADANAEVASDLAALCPGTAVDPSGDVTRSGNCDLAIVPAGPNPIGCCCICILTASLNPWTIEIHDATAGAVTDRAGRKVKIPRASALQPMHWSDSAAGTEHLAPSRRSIVLGHELCGHGALSEIGAHPDTAAAGTRVDNDLHDPTVAIERQIWDEQAMPAADRRGFATGTHRGESAARVAVTDFRFNSADVSLLPMSEQRKIDLAFQFIRRNDMFVDIVGHSDPVSSTPTGNVRVSQQRAEAMRRALGRPPMTADVTVAGATTTLTLPRFGRVDGVGDSEPPAPATLPHEKWRRVDITMARYPAGRAVPPAGTPGTAAHIRAETPATVASNLATPGCRERLTSFAWSRGAP